MSDVPQKAFIEHQILSRAAVAGALSEATREVENEYRLEAAHLGTGLLQDVRALSLLYCLVLYAWEHFRLPDRKAAIHEEISERWSLDGITVVTPETHFKDPVYGFIRRLRNAVAHANVEFTDAGMEFWDCHDRKEVYRARMSLEQVERFLGTVGGLMADERNRPSG